MTDKELQKLGRRELLQLLLDQAKEAEQLRAELTAVNDRTREMDETFQHLRECLNDKDAQIRELGETCGRLRDKLDEKDAQIQELNDALQAEREGRISALGEIGSIAEAALQLNGIFEAAQKAADLYLEKVHEVCPLPQGVMETGTVIRPTTDGDGTVTPPPREPMRSEASRSAAESAPKRDSSQKKRLENRRRFVFSFGWEKPDQ